MCLQATPTAPRQHQKRQENPNHTSPLSLLPEALLANILESVPQQNRLKDASVVCRAWARCANAATTSITCHPSCRYLGPANYKDLQYDDKLTPLSTWLSQHAKQVESMEVRIHGSQKLVLPCANLALLTKLDVSYGKVELQLPDTALASSSSASASPAILPKLCQLQLSACTFTSSAALLRLPPLPTVTNLRLSGMPSIEGQKLDDGRGSAALMLMRCLPQLADLRLFDIRAPELVELVAAIPSSLTALELTCYTVGVSYFPQSTPQLAQLQSLVLEEAAFDPRALGDMSRLVRLEVHCCMFLPPDNQGAAAFMAALCGLQQLEQLAVVNTNLLKARPQDCAALTVSPHLTKLVLRQSEQQLLSAGAVSHMMPPGRQLQLQKLVLTSGYRHGRDRGAPCMSAVELQRLISACPSLHSLDITCALQPGGVDTLLQLPSTCCSLAVGGPCFDDAAAATLIQLTQLTDLSWSSSPVTDAGLDHLTALSCLQRLCLEEDHGLSQALIGYDGYMDEPYELVASSKLRTKTRSPACNAPLKVRLTATSFLCRTNVALASSSNSTLYLCSMH